MLSSQTKDEVTNAAIANLRAAFGGSISLEAMIEADENVISEAISKVGFWRRKTGFVFFFSKEKAVFLHFSTAISSKLLSNYETTSTRMCPRLWTSSVLCLAWVPRWLS